MLKKVPITGSTINAIAPIEGFPLPKPKKDPDANMFDRRFHRAKENEWTAKKKFSPGKLSDTSIDIKKVIANKYNFLPSITENESYSESMSNTHGDDISDSSKVQVNNKSPNLYSKTRKSRKNFDLILPQSPLKTNNNFN